MEDNGIDNKKLLVARVMKDIEKYVKECDMCQRIKNRTEIPTGKLKLSKIPEKLWTHLIVG